MIIWRISRPEPDAAPTTFTVAIPTHNRRELLLLAVESAQRQTRPPRQILVVADGCSDGTQEAVVALRDERVELLDLPKAYAVGYANRDEAVRRARGDVIAWLADDDLILPGHLAELGAIYDAGGVDLVQASACVVHEDDALSPLGMDWRVPYYRGLMLKGQNRTPASAVSHRRRLVVEAGGWPAGKRRRGDQDLWQRMLLAGVSTSMAPAPTVLHFRAAWRDQAYRDRVSQGRRFLDRMQSRDDLARLRSEMGLAAQRQAAAQERRRKRLLLGIPHLRARAMLRIRFREAIKDGRLRTPLASRRRSGT